MVADELAVSIALATVHAGSRVVDPFCGSGRLLMAAAAQGAHCVGFDVNPLACLITDAKAASACPFIIEGIQHDVASASGSASPIAGLSLGGAKVPWFSDAVAVELAQIIRWIDSLNLSRAELLVVATALSAATRDAAWIRKSGWKLHRMSQCDREACNASAWERFAARLRQYVRASKTDVLTGTVRTRLVRAGAAYAGHGPCEQFDVLLTSPPYGDSKTTVQYGAASGLCLDVVSRIAGLEDYRVAGNEIDRACLGGIKPKTPPDFDLRRYWAGSTRGKGAKRVSCFLQDFGDTCRALVPLLKPAGTAVMVVGRRSVGGYRVKLDEFAAAELAQQGLQLRSVEKRWLQHKTMPGTINRFARADCEAVRARGVTKTMDKEIILTFVRDG